MLIGGCVAHQLISASVAGIGSLIDGGQNAVWPLALEDEFRRIMKRDNCLNCPDKGKYLFSRNGFLSSDCKMSEPQLSHCTDKYRHYSILRYRKSSIKPRTYLFQACLWGEGGGELNREGGYFIYRNALPVAKKKKKGERNRVTVPQNSQNCSTCEIAYNSHFNTGRNKVYYMEESVLLGTKPLVDSIRHFIRDRSGVFSVCHLF